MKRTFAGVACILLIAVLATLLTGCGNDKSADSETWNVPHEGQWGIYSLDLASKKTVLLYQSNDEIGGINLSNSGYYIAFSEKIQDSVKIDTTSEIYVLDIRDGYRNRLTNNSYFDTYPSFSPDDSNIVFLSLRDSTLDLYMMYSDGAGQQILYNSGGHDADVDWGSDGRIAFTRNQQIWTINSEGDDPRRVTDPADAGLWGSADLPVGDYDPRFNPAGNTIAFERLVDVSHVHGGYDIYVASANGGDESNLTNTGTEGYARGFVNWSHSGDKLVYVLAAIGAEGKYDLYMMNSDGSQNRSITPDYYPAAFLCRNAIFSLDDSKVYFVGQWWN